MHLHGVKSELVQQLRGAANFAGNLFRVVLTIVDQASEKRLLERKNGRGGFRGRGSLAGLRTGNIGQVFSDGLPFGTRDIG